MLYFDSFPLPLARCRKPTLADCEEVVQALARRFEEEGQDSALLISVVLAAVAIGVGWWLWRKQRKP